MKELKLHGNELDPKYAFLGGSGGRSGRPPGGDSLEPKDGEQYPAEVEGQATKWRAFFRDGKWVQEEAKATARSAGEEGAPGQGAERMTEGSSTGDGLPRSFSSRMAMWCCAHSTGGGTAGTVPLLPPLERFGDDLLEVVEAMLDAAADAASDLHEQHSGESRNGWALMFHDEGSTLH